MKDEVDEVGRCIRGEGAGPGPGDATVVDRRRTLGTCFLAQSGEDAIGADVLPAVCHATGEGGTLRLGWVEDEACLDRALLDRLTLLELNDGTRMAALVADEVLRDALASASAAASSSLEARRSATVCAMDVLLFGLVDTLVGFAGVLSASSPSSTSPCVLRLICSTSLGRSRWKAPLWTKFQERRFLSRSERELVASGARLLKPYMLSWRTNDANWACLK